MYCAFNPMPKSFYDDIMKNFENRCFVNLRNCDVHAHRAVQVAKKIRKSTKLEQLEIDNNKIGDVGLISIADAIQHSVAPIRMLDLRDCHISDVSVCILAKSLEKNAQLQKLYLGWNKIGDDGVKAISKTLESNTSLLELCLWNTEMGDDGLAALSQAIGVNKTIQRVLLSHNKRFTLKGVRAFAHGIQQNISLRESISVEIP